jgi:hypothetical protein
MVKPANRSESGVTVVETVVSLGILAVFLGSLFVAQARDFHFIGDSMDEAKAERIAASRLESILGRRETPAPGSRTGAPEPSLADALPGARVEETVRDAGRGVLEVEVRVHWTGAGGAGRSFTLSTLLAAEAAR